MTNRSDEYCGVTEDERQKLIELARQPESLLNRYDEDEE
jgi:hypothetical protein